MATSVAKVPMLFLYVLVTSNIFCGVRVLAEGSKKLFLQFNKPSQGPDVEAGSLALTHVPDSVRFRTTAGSIQLQDVPQVISLAMGFSSLQDIEWKGLLASKNIFNRPKANVLFIIEGLDKGATFPLFSKTLSYPIIKRQTEPNLDVFRISPFHNFISHITSIVHEKPLVISLSGETKIAESSSDNGPNSHTITWNAEKNSFIDSNTENEITLSRSELLKKFETADFGEDVHFQKGDGKFLVSAQGMKETLFDMNKAQDFLFFAELEMIKDLYEKVKISSSSLKASSPNFFTFGISSLKGLSDEYGNNSQQVLAAVRILDKFLPQLTSLFSELYKGQALVEVVTLECSKIDLTEDISSELNDLYNYVKQHLQSPSLENFNKNLPTLNLQDNLEDHAVGEICKSVQSRLLTIQSNIKVICGVLSSENHQRHKRETTEEATQGIDCDNPYNLASMNDKYDSLFPPIFNISLWLMIAIGLALYAVCLVLWYMDPGRDSIIYRVTSQRIKSE